MGTARSPSLADLLEHAMTARIREVHTAIVANVVAYDHTKQTVDVQPVVTRVFVDPNGDEVTERYPQITNVPVAFPQAGGFFVSFPIQPGDAVLLIFMERPISQWRAKGSETDPADLRTHGTGSAIAIPGVVPSAKALAGADASSMIMGKDGGPQIGIDATLVNLGEKSAANFVALANKVDAMGAELKAKMLVLATAVAAGFTSLPAALPSGGAAAGSALTAASATYTPVLLPTAATKVKAT